MQDLKALTVRILRQLAREHLVPGYSRLKKADLIAALKKCLSSRASRRAKVAASRASSARPPGVAEPMAPSRAAQPVPAPRVARVPAPRVVEPVAASSARVSQAVSVKRRPGAEPVIEGFFLGSRQSETGPSNGATQLPVSYGDDALHLLPRDPSTLFVFWDFDDQLRDRAAAGLKWPRAVLRVFDRGSLVREVEVALEARSFYLYDLQPGRTYQVEAHFVGQDDRSRRIGRPSNAVALPGLGQPPSPGEVRFLRVPFELPVRNLKEAIGRGEAQLQTLNPEQAKALGSVPVLGVVRTEDSNSERRGGPSGSSRWNPSGQSWNPSGQS